MIVEKNVHLAAKTTMKIGGYADVFYIPETEEELTQLAQQIYDEDWQVFLLSGGSNLLISDERRFDRVVYMRAACTDRISLGEGRFYIGASNRIQQVIAFVNEFGYGGFEELVGLPALFGGIIYMNAGIGGAQKPLFTIGEFVESVRVWDLDEKKMLELPVEQCGFTHRASAFHHRSCVILGAVIRCKECSAEQAKAKKEARLQFCKKNFEYGKGCFGTCFSKVNYRLLKILSVYDKVGKPGKGRVTLGTRNKNWLVNHGNGTYRDTINIINACKRLHRLARREVCCEVIIWK